MQIAENWRGVTVEMALAMLLKKEVNPNIVRLDFTKPTTANTFILFLSKTIVIILFLKIISKIQMGIMKT